MSTNTSDVTAEGTSAMEDAHTSVTSEKIDEESATPEVDNDDSDESKIMDWDDFVDEVGLKDLELTFSIADKEVCFFNYVQWYTCAFYFDLLSLHVYQRLKAEAEEIKEKGNVLFKSGEFRESAITYTLALRTCPISFPHDRSKLYSNRAAAKMKLVRWIIYFTVACALVGGLFNHHHILFCL